IEHLNVLHNRKFCTICDEIYQALSYYPGNQQKNASESEQSSSSNASSSDSSFWDSDTSSDHNLSPDSRFFYRQKKFIENAYERFNQHTKYLTTTHLYTKAHEFI